jgi:hypothetical protein
MTDATFHAPGTRPTDHDDEGPARPGETTLLEDLAAELTAELEDELEPIEVPERPGWSVVYSKAITNDNIKAWRKRAKDGKNVDELRLACIILGNQCRRLVRNGVTITAGEEAVTFASPAFHGLYGVGTARDAIRAFYGRDGHVLMAANRVVEAAGYGAELEDVDEDPTDGS